MATERVASVAASGDRLATLRALRDRLASDLDESTSARDCAALSQRLMDVLQQIADAEKVLPLRESPRDVVAEKRRERAAAREGVAARSRRSAQR